MLRDDVVGDDPVAAIEALLATGQRGPVEDDRGGVRERGESHGSGDADQPDTPDEPDGHDGPDGPARS